MRQCGCEQVSVFCEHVPVSAVRPVQGWGNFMSTVLYSHLISELTAVCFLSFLITAPYCCKFLSILGLMVAVKVTGTEGCSVCGRTVLVSDTLQGTVHCPYYQCCLWYGLCLYRYALSYTYDMIYTGCFKKSFTTLKAYRNLYRGHTQCFELSKCSKTHRVLPRIVIRNCFDLFFSVPSWYLHRHCPPTWETVVEVLAHFSKVTYNFESVQRTYTTFWTVKM
jgi:hypothetical protein